MAFVTGDRVKETTTTTGTGSLALAGAVSNFQAFSAVAANNDTIHYAIVHQTAAEWEVGIGTWLTGNTLARTTVLESSNADALVNLSAGTKDVFCPLPSEKALLMRERPAPDAAATNWATFFAFLRGTTRMRSKDAYGLLDQMGTRDRYAFRREYYLGVGSDSSAGTNTDLLNYGFPPMTAEGTLSQVTFDVDGSRRNYATAATLDTDAGIFTTAAMMRRDFNPDFTIRFRVPTTVTRRVWIGFTELDHMATDSTATTHKFMLRLSTSPAVTGFTIVHSDGTTETVEAQIQASDTLIHTIRLVADDANARWGYSFDGAAIVWITTNIPAATANLLFQIQIRTLAAAAANLEFAWVMGSADK